jgi:hypothetical protein
MQTELRNETLGPVVLDLRLLFCASPNLANLEVLGPACALTGKARGSALLSLCCQTALSGDNCHSPRQVEPPRHAQLETDCRW